MKRSNSNTRACSGASVKKAKTTTVIDADWANSLAGTRLTIPNSWWDGYKKTDNAPNEGKIVKFDSSSTSTQECRFSIMVDEAPYTMRYDAIVKYADKNIKCKLPPLTVSISAEKVSRLR